MPHRSGLLALLFAAAASSPLVAQRASVVFGGTVVDSLRQPLGNAEVSLPALSLATTTNDKGVFEMNDVPAGVHRVVVKRIGYGQLDTTMSFPADSMVRWRVTLGRIVTLDSVLVTAPLDPLMLEFEASRARGFGRFLTDADLRKRDGTTFANVMRSVSGVSITRSRVGASYISSKRQPQSGCIPPRPPTNTPTRGESIADALAAQAAVDECLRRERTHYVPDEVELRQGVTRACYPQVWVDRSLMNSGIPTPPFDIDQYSTEQIEAVEWYESTSQVPPRYTSGIARCGVLVLHMKKKRR